MKVILLFILTFTNLHSQKNEVSDIREKFDNARDLLVSDSLNSIRQFQEISKKITTSQKRAPSETEIDVLIDIANLYVLQLSKFKQADSILLEAVSYSKKIGYIKGEANGALTLGISNSIRGNFDKASELYVQALPYFETLKDTANIIRTVRNIGYTYIELKEVNQARTYLNKAIDLAEQSNNLLQKVEISTGLVILNLRNNVAEGVYDILIGLEKDAKKLPQSTLKERHLEGRINELFADYYVLLKQPDMALKYCTKAYQNFKESEFVNHFHLLGSIEELVETHLILKNYKEAEKYCLEGISISKQYNFLDQELLFSSKLFSLRNKSSIPSENSLELANRIIQLKDSIYNKTIFESVANITKKYESEKKDKEILQQKAKIARNKFETTRLIVVFSLLLLGLSIFIIYRISLNNKFKKRVNKLLKKRNNELQLSMKKRELLEEKVENIQNEISKDLHDNFGNRFAAIETCHSILKDINVQQNKYPEDFERFSKHLERSLRGLSSDIKDLIWINNRKNNKWSRVVSRIKMLCDNFSKTNHIAITIENNTEKDFITPIFFNRQLLLIVKEILNNTNKHAQATKIEIVISANKNGYISITSKDNGVGFDLNRLDRINGLENMKQRAASIGCELEIESKPGAGTQVRLFGNITLKSTNNSDLVMWG